MKKFSPFSGLVAEALDIELIKLLKVNRENELKKCVVSLYERSENLLLYGARGVGKTFLVRLIHEEIKANYAEVVPALVNLTSLFAYHPLNVISAFPKAVLLELCKTIWIDVLGKDYSTLRSVLAETGNELKFRKKGEKKLISIYKLLMTTGRKIKVSDESTIGVAAGFKGDVKSAETREWSEFDTLPFEFFEFIEEIMEVTLKPKKKNRIIILCDEANKLSIFQQSEILERYLELFAARDVQFLFVAGYLRGGKIENLPSVFQNIVELKGFKEKLFVKELIEKHTSNLEISFSESALDVVWEIFQGHLVDTLTACRMAYERATQDKTREIDSKTMAIVCTQLLRQQEEYRKFRVP